VWAVSSDPPEKLQALASYAHLTFPLLSDTTLAVINAYGVRDERYPIAHPTALVIDRKGIVRYAREDLDYRVRPAPEELLAALQPRGHAK
jgi:peroxiredoxin